MATETKTSTKVTKKQFLADVMHEIETLRQLATPEEKERLNFDGFNPESPTRCIYGQLTRNCQSRRAKELMDKACIRVMNLDNGTDELYERDSKKSVYVAKPFSEIAHKVNGENQGQGWYKSGGLEYRKYSHISVLEAYINLKDAKNANVLAYIKGDTNKLKL